MPLTEEELKVYGNPEAWPEFMRSALIPTPPGGPPVWPDADPAATAALLNASSPIRLEGEILPRMPRPSAARGTPQQSPAWLAGAQLSAVPASPPWPQPPQPPAPQPQSPTMGQPARSFIDAVAAHGDPLFQLSGRYPTPPSGHRAPDQLDLSDPFAAAAYRQRNAVRPLFGRGDPARAEAAIRAGLVSAADSFGIPSWLIGQVSPATKDLIREQYEDHPIASTIGSLATSAPRFAVRAFEAAAKEAPKTLATVLGLGGLALSSDEAQGAGRLPMFGAKGVGRSAVDKYWRNMPTEFGRNAPAEFGRAPEGEKVALPAVKLNLREVKPTLPDKEVVFTGPGGFHSDAIEIAERELKVPALPGHSYEGQRQGWTSTANRYLTREAANDLARLTKQHPTEDMRGLRSGGRPRLQEGDAAVPSNVRTAVTAPDLPGGGGPVQDLPDGSRVYGDAAWGWLLSKSEAARLPRRTRPPASPNDPQERALTTYRADRTHEINARGMSQEEIYKYLNELAWPLDHDAAILRNYTSPFGRTGDVVVVKDRAQLRDPKARFDPRKRDSRNVMAGFAGAGLLGPYFLGVPRPAPDQ